MVNPLVCTRGGGKERNTERQVKEREGLDYGLTRLRRVMNHTAVTRQQTWSGLAYCQDKTHTEHGIRPQRTVHGVKEHRCTVRPVGPDLQSQLYFYTVVGLCLFASVPTVGNCDSGTLLGCV